jgi:hypothetical protein
MASPEDRNNSRILMHASAWLFPMLLWWLGCFLYHGDLGRYSDDWAMGAVNPATGHFDWTASPFPQAYFWRPLLQLFLHFVMSLLWDHMWVFHLLNVLTHAITALLVWRLLRRLLSTPQAAAAGALVFLIFPNNYEVIFWSTAMTTGLGTLCAVVLAHCVITWSRSAMVLSSRWLITCGVLAFAIPCWYEQPSAMVLGLPLLALAASNSDITPRSAVLRSAVLAAVCGVSVLCYVILLLQTAPAQIRGAGGSYISMLQMPTRAVEFVSAVKWFYTSALSDAVRGGLEFAHANITSISQLAVIGGTGIAGGFWLAGWWLPTPSPRTRPGNRAAWTWCFAVVTLIASWAPMFIVRGQILEARHNYYSMVPISLLIGLCIDAALSGSEVLRRHRLCKALVGTTVAAAVWLLALSLFGMQSLMRERTRGDLAQMNGIAAAAPAAPAGTIFMALEDNYRPAHTGRLFFDARLIGWIMASWSANPGVQHAFHRADVFATYRNFWVPLTIDQVDAEGYRYNVGPNQSGLPDPLAGKRHRWDETVPYIIEDDGRISLVSAMTVSRPGDEPLTLRFPRVGASKGAATEAVRHVRDAYELKLPGN